MDAREHIYQYFINGNEFRIHSLSPQLDSAFQKMTNALLFNGNFAWQQIDSASESFFTQSQSYGAQRSKVQDLYFENMAVIFNKIMGQGDYRKASYYWEKVFQFTHEWEKTNKMRVHKGTGYYWWAVSEIQQKHLDKAFLIMHQALKEDELTSGKPYHQLNPMQTPSLSFVTGCYFNPGQAYREWPIKIAQYLINQIDQYNLTYKKNFKISVLWNEFKSLEHSLIFYFNHTISEIIVFEENLNGFQNQFVSLLVIDKLFNLTQVIERYIQEKRGVNYRGYVVAIADLAINAGINLLQQDLAEINGRQNQDFDAVLVDLLNNTFSTKNNKIITGLMADLSIAYIVRNYSAHNIRFSGELSKRYKQVLHSIFNTLFLSIQVHVP